jgi:hypothetical protein
MTPTIRIGLATLTLTLAPIIATTPALAKMTSFEIVLSGAKETPPHPVAGKGFGTACYDDKTHELNWNVSFRGLTGAATMAHFHGPAKPGVAAGVQVVMGSPASPVISPLIGSATLTDAQAKDLLAGLYYVNIHTAANPKGEIRGQVVKTGHHRMMSSVPVKAAAPAMNSMGGTMQMNGTGGMGGMQMEAPAKP